MMLADSRQGGGAMRTSFLGEVDGAVRCVTAGFEEGC